MIYLPRSYQPPITDFIVDHERSNIFARMGSGKTAATLEAFARLKLFGEVDRMCIIAPKRVAMNVWREAVNKDFVESFGHLTIASAVGTPEQRKKAVLSRPDILCVNFESAEWLLAGYGEHWPFKMVVADESGRLKGLRIGTRVSSKGKEYLQGQGSVRAKALTKIAFKHVRRWTNLNGSPAPNGIIDTWGPQWFVDGGAALGTSFTAFEQRFFRTFNNADGYTGWEPLPHAQREIEDLMRPTSITVDPRKALGVKDTIETIVWVDLPPAARRAYDAMEKELFADLRNGIQIEAFNNGSKANKCLQLANGAVFHDTAMRAWTTTHDEKIEALRSVVSETNGEPLLVRYCFTPDRERILKAFPGFRFFDDNPRTKAEWDAGHIPGLVTHAASAGHGLNLQKPCRILVDYSSQFNLGEDEQIIERIGGTRQVQSGFDRDVYRYRIIARDTIEEHSVLPRLQHKMSVQDAFLHAMKRRTP
jgi:hypothetical protein